MSGTIDLQQNVNAHVTAQLLRDTCGRVQLRQHGAVAGEQSGVGEWVTGPLKDPKSEPVYVLPKLLLFPLHPIRTLEDMIPIGTSFTNRPPDN